ncbi:MAG: Penicillin-binding protein 1A [Firmicutes bacterium]|nr:Penicillin-binding protein 1A [Bacillota bacterium]
MNAKKAAAKSAKKPTKGTLLRALYIIIVALFAVFAMGLGVVYYFVYDIPDPTFNQPPRETSFVLDANGETIAQLHAEQNRVTVPLSAFPAQLVEGVIVMEDIRFYSHFGVSPRDLIRAAYLTLTRQDFQGASTITQQVARNYILSDQSVTIRRKVQEIYVALLLERKYSKTEILEIYLNEIFLGGSAHGFQAAAQQYFGKDVSDLTLAESSMLVGLLPSPNAWRPRAADMAPARRRQGIVLAQLLRHGRITEAERDAALAAPINLVTPRTQPGETALAMYFVDHVITQAEDILVEQRRISRAEASKMIHTKGLTIKTTLNLDLQRAAERAALEIFTQENGILQRQQREARNDPNPEIRKLAAAETGAFTWSNAHGLQPQVSMLVIEPSTGFIRAWVGGRDMIGRFGRDRVAREQRQPGSAIKPLLVYGPPLAAGRITAASTVDDAPVRIPTGNPNEPLFVPRNFDFNTFWGHTSIRTGLARSYNVMAAKLFHSFGISNSIEWAKRLGITSFVEPGGPEHDYVPAAALGGMTRGMTLFEQVRAYNVFNNRGILVEPSAILSISTRDGAVLYTAPSPEKRVVISEQVAWLMTDILRGTVENRDGVTGTGFFGLRGGAMGRFPGEAAGKTGTTTNNVDAVFMGYTPDFTAGVWIGHDDRTTGIPTRKGGQLERRAIVPALEAAPTNETAEERLQRLLRADPFVRGAFPSTGSNAVGSGFATAIFGRTMSLFTRNAPAAQLAQFPREWYEEYGVFGPPRRLGFVRASFCSVSGKYPSSLCPAEDIRSDWFIAGTEPRPVNPCDMHVLVKICVESGQLATDFCPPHTVVQQLRVRRDPYLMLLDRSGNQLHPADRARQVPFERCTVHSPPSGNDGPGGGN